MALSLLIPAFGALSSWLSGRSKARTSTSTPTIAPEFKGISDLLRGRAEERLRTPMDMGGIEAGGISNINDAFEGITDATNADLTRRGLASSPVAATVGTNLQTARGSNIAQFLNSLPQLQRNFETQDTNNALNVLNIGRGTQTVGPGSGVGDAFSSAAELLAYMRGRGGGFGGGGIDYSKSLNN